MLRTKVRAMIVDDSALVRKVLSEILDSDPLIEVVGVAADPHDARAKIKELNPDVLTLDIEMPKMDGITFLKNLMRLRPMPVVMVSSLTEPGAEITLNALEIGAIDFIAKPKVDVANGLEDYGDELISKVKTAAAARPRTLSPTPTSASAPAPAPAATLNAVGPQSGRLIAVGSSTGGTEALRELIGPMPPNGPPIVIAQHIPSAFVAALVSRLNMSGAMTVVEAQSGLPLQSGHAYIAPGAQHIRIRRRGQDYICILDGSGPVNGHRPSVDVLFDSVASEAGSDATAVLLTGMGSDGAVGMGRIRAAGGHTVVQDENTSVVWGMPGEAVRIGAACEVLPLAGIAPHILSSTNLAATGASAHPRSGMSPNRFK